MPHGQRRFAKNSENVRHFRLVARSQKDPEGDKEEASPLVLEPFVPSRLVGKVDEAEQLTIPESLQHLDPDVFGLDTRGGVPEENSSDGEEDDGEERDELDELDDDCYFPKDGYNYNQHLKTLSKNKKTGGVGGVVLDVPVKKEEEVKPQTDEYGTLKDEDFQQASNFEEREVFEALMDCDNPGYDECDGEFFDELGGVVEQPELMLWGPTALENDDLPDLALFKEMHAQRLAAMAGEDGDEEYDEDGREGAGEAISAVRFEQLLEDEYDDGETGALDDEEIEGGMSMENMEAMLDEYLEDREAEKQKMESINEPIKGKYDDVPRVIDETKAIIERQYRIRMLKPPNEDEEVAEDEEGEEDEADAETSEGDSEEDESKNWDCETVLSTLSNLSNRPGKITKIKLIKKPAPDKDLPAIAEKGSGAEDESDEEDAVELPDVVTERPKDESAEDKKQRKAAVKEMRRICRRMKKESKEMYKNEAAKLNKKNGTGDVREKLRCLKL